MAKRLQINQALIRGVTTNAVNNWLVDSGIVGKKGEIKFKRTLKSYGLKTPYVNKLSKHVIDVVKDETGVDFKVTADQLSHFGDGTIETYIKCSVDEFIAALPGEPTTLPGKPLSGRPVTLPSPGEPTTLPSRPKEASALPGEPITLPSKPAGKR